MRHGLQLPSRSRDERVQQRIANLENVPSAQRAAPMQTGNSGRRRILHGDFTSTTPTITNGEGFTLTRNGVGDVTVNFNVNFGGTPTPFFSANGGTSLAVTDVIFIGANSMRCRIQTTGGVAQEGTGHFIVVGPA